MEELNSRAGQHRISLVNREVCAINGVSDVLSFDVGEVLLETEQGMLMIRGSELHVSRLTLEKGEVDIDGRIDSLTYSEQTASAGSKAESLLSRLNRNETDSVDSFITRCIEQAEQISRESNGAYDITIKPLTAAYGFAGDSTTGAPNIDSLLQLVGYKALRSISSPRGLTGRGSRTTSSKWAVRFSVGEPIRTTPCGTSASIVQSKGT